MAAAPSEHQSGKYGGVANRTSEAVIRVAVIKLPEAAGNRKPNDPREELLAVRDGRAKRLGKRLRSRRPERLDALLVELFLA